jgi:hypothetical protein
MSCMLVIYCNSFLVGSPDSDDESLTALILCMSVEIDRSSILDVVKSVFRNAIVCSMRPYSSLFEFLAR